MKNLKDIPLFKDETEEAAFWDEHDVTEYFDMSQAKRTRFANLKKTTKVKANAMDVPYQSLIKMYLTNALKTA